MTKSKAKNNPPSTAEVPEKNIDLLIYELAQASQCEKVKPELEAQLDQLVASTPPVKVRSFSSSSSMTRISSMNSSPAPRTPMFTTSGQEDDYTSTGSIRSGIGPRNATTLTTGGKAKATISFDAELGQLESQQDQGTIASNDLTTAVSLENTPARHTTTRTTVTASDRDQALSSRSNRGNARIDVFNDVFDDEDNFMHDLFEAVEEKRATIKTSPTSLTSSSSPHRHLDPISEAFDQIENNELPPRARRSRNKSQLTPKLQAKQSIESNRYMRLEEDVVAKLHGAKSKPSEPEDFLTTGKTALTRRYNEKKLVTPPKRRVAHTPTKPVELPPRPKGKDIRARVEFIMGIGNSASQDDDE